MSETDINDRVKYLNDEVGRLNSEYTKSYSRAENYRDAFIRVKGLVSSIINVAHWSLRLGVLGCSFWFIGWRFAAGVLSFIFADEIIRHGKCEIEKIEP